MVRKRPPEDIEDNVKWQVDTENPGSDGASPYRLDTEDDHD
jgi:hypothetical protein